MSAEATRRQIVEAADEMFYERGFEHTSFADIAQVVRISRGNFYYHFKTKDEILDAVIARRLANTQTMLNGWEAEGQDPADRIRSFIHILTTNRAKIMAFGCPVGTLCAELSKLDHAAQTDAARIFELYRGWLRRQFMLLGRDTEADRLAMHILGRSQGVAALANAFHDEEFTRREVDQMCAWLDTLARGDPPPSAAPSTQQIQGN